MKKFVTVFLAVVVVFAVTLTGFAAGGRLKIDVEWNPATIEVMGEVKNVDHFIYNGTTYVPLRALAEMLDVEVHWDNDTKLISVYRLEPREFRPLSFANIPITDNGERNTEYDRKLIKIQNDLYHLISELEAINLPNTTIDVNTFLDFQYKRTLIEDKLYSERFDVSYRVPIFTILKVLDNIEMALIRSHNGGDPKQIEHNLKVAREYVDYVPFLGF